MIFGIMEDVNLNYTKGDLFKSDVAISKFNACVGSNGGPYNYIDYSYGYFSSAKILAEKTLTTEMGMDLSIYPLVFLYRHAIELSLKNVIYFLWELNAHERKIIKSHNIIELWKSAKQMLQETRELKEDKEIIAFVDKFLQDISDLDSTAEVFRFPETKRRELHLQDRSHINIYVLYSLMNKLERIFKYWFEYKFHKL